MTASPIRVLIFAEGATLAHVARPFVLAEELCARGHDLIFARPPTYAWLTQNAAFKVVNLDSQSPSVFASRLRWGKSLYDISTLESYVEADRKFIRRYKPDVVIGDFRLSLAVSARLEKVPYATICDAYWSPEANNAKLPLPVLPFTRYFPTQFGERLFNWVKPLALRRHAGAMEQLRRNHGLPGIGFNLYLAYSDADLRLFASIPELFPAVEPSASAKFAGPIAWSPQMEISNELPDEKNIAYLTMGSSGDLTTLDSLFSALRTLSIVTVVATAGRKIPLTRTPSNIHFFDFLPGKEIAALAKIVICNGGSPSTNQSLMAGTPVLGIPGNMDQMLNMQSVVSANCGIAIRADRANKANILAALCSILDGGSSFNDSAKRIANTTVPIDRVELIEHLTH